MTDPAPKRWTTAEFFAWQERQSDRYELVDGFPVRMMADAKNVHDDIAVNILVGLGSKLRVGGCRPFTADGPNRARSGAVLKEPDQAPLTGR